MSAVRDRFLFGTLLLGGVIGVLTLDHALASSAGFLVLVLLFGLVSWLEFLRMARAGGRPTALWGALVLVATLAAEWWLLRGERTAWPRGEPLADALVDVLTLAAMAGPGAFLIGHCWRRPSRARLEAAAVVGGGLLYLLLPLTLLLRMRLQEGGERWVLLAVLVVKGNDIGAYLTGRAIGRTPLTAISPKKTVEGSLGGLALGTAVAFGFAWIPESPLFGVGGALLVALAGGVAGQLGDLVESLGKRAFAVKDSGALVPAFGGALDMLDSVLVGGPVIYLVSRWGVA